MPLDTAVSPGDGLEVKASPIDGKGLFATRPFAAGDVLDPAALTRRDGPAGEHRYDESVAARFTNHQARPSARLARTGDGVGLVAARALAAGDEVTINYRTVGSHLQMPFSLWYDGKPYAGESTSGAPRLGRGGSGEIDDPDDTDDPDGGDSAVPARVKAALFDGLGATLQSLVVNPVVGNWATGHGLVYAPGQGNLVDRMDAIRAQQGAFGASATAAEADRPTYARLFGGAASAAGVDPNRPAVGRLADRFGRDVAGLSPYIRAHFPEVWERLHGWRGSAANLAAKMHQTAQGVRDPVTGRRGQGGEAVAARATGIFDRLYGTGADRAASAGLSAAQMGDLDATAKAKGLLGSQTPLAPAAHADRLADLARPVAAARDLLGVHAPKAAAAPGGLTGRRHVGDREETVCPHCDRPVRVRDLYRDAKGWLFHRPCLRKGKGPIRLKTAVDTGQAVDLLEKLTQGQLPNLDKGQVALDARQLGELAKTTPGGLPRLLGMIGHGGEAAEAVNLPRQFASRTAPSAAAFGQAYGQLAGGQGFAGLTPDDATDLDQRLRLSAAGSPMANMMAATLALDDAGLIRPGTPAAAAAEAFRRGDHRLPDGMSIGRLTTPQWVEMLARSGVSPPAAWEQYRATDSNREYAFKHRLTDSVRGAQAEVEVRPMIRSFLGQGMMPTLGAAGVGGPHPIAVAAPLAETMSHALVTAPAALLTGDRRALIGHLATAVAAAHPDAAARLGPAGMAELTHTALTGVDQAVRSDERLSPYRNLTGLLTAHRPDILHAGTAATADARREAVLRDRTAHLGEPDWLRRTADAVQETTAATPLTETVAKGFGAVQAAPVAAAVDHATGEGVPLSAALAPAAPAIAAGQAARRQELATPSPIAPGTPTGQSPYVPAGPGQKKKAGVTVNGDLYFAPYDPAEFELPEAA